MWDDLEVEVGQAVAGGLEVRILRSPFNRPRAAFVSPFPEIGAREKWQEIDTWLQAYIRTGGDLSQCSALDLRDLGGRLCDALFPEPLRKTLDLSEGRASERGGLRIRLSFDTSAKAVNEAAVFPWELLWSPRSEEFFALEPGTPLVRYLDASEPRRSLQIARPLRVLLVDSNPGTKLDLETEKEAIVEAVEGSTAFEIETLTEPTLDSLVRMLEEKDFHVVHFMGHAGFDEQGGFVLFEDRDGHERAVTDRALASVLSAEIPLRLVVLAACRAAQLSRPEETDTLHGAAARLTRKGLAVIAMQFVISDGAAAVFSGALYRALVRGELLETAVTRGRRAIFHEDETSAEWASPVLFLGVPEGRLLQVPRARGSDLAAETTGVRRLGIVSMGRDMWGREAREAVEHCLDLGSFFETRHHGRYIRNTALWPVVQEEIARFLPGVVARDRANVLELATHQSIAYAAGRSLEAMSGYETVVRQRSIDGVHDWHIDQGEVPPALWSQLDDRPLEAGGGETALAVTVTQEVGDSVRSYLESSGPPVDRLLIAGVEEGSLSIRSGAHAFWLAEKLFQWVRDRRREDASGASGPLHLFLSGPVGFAFFLGRLTRDWGEVQLYEHDRDRKVGTLYFPVLRVPGAPKDYLRGNTQP